MEKSYVTLEQKLCPICGTKEDSDALLLDTHLRKKFEMHTLTGYGHCKKCQIKLDEKYVALIEVSNEPSGTTMKQENACRTGRLVWVKKTAFDEIFNVENKSPMVFVQPDVLKYLSSLIPAE